MANYKYINDRGVIVPDTSELRTEVESEWLTAFGSDLSLEPGTPQGVMISGEVTARAGVIENNVMLANQINPNLAGGLYLDAICALLGLQRAPATQSVVSNVLLGGQPGTNVPAGSRAKSVNGDVFELLMGAVITVSGFSTPVQFRAVEYGPIGCNVGELNAVLDSVLGWTSVNNGDAAVIGQNRQSDASLRALRNRTLALQGISTVEAQVSAINALPGVRSMQFRENIAATTQIIDGISMVAHSVWACVDGGTDLDIATALLNNKTDGAAWNGAEIVTVTEPFSGQDYDVKFDRAAQIAIKVRVTVKVAGSQVDPALVIPQLVVDYANGTGGEEAGFRVGVGISPFEIAAAINSVYPSFFISKVEVALLAGAYQTTELAMAINQVATITNGSVLVVTV